MHVSSSCQTAVISTYCTNNLKFTLIFPRHLQSTGTPRPHTFILPNYLLYVSFWNQYFQTTIWILQLHITIFTPVLPTKYSPFLATTHASLFIDIILPATLRPWGRLSHWQKWVPGIFPGGKGGWCVGLTTLPPSCADCLEIWEPQPAGTLRGLYRDCFTFYLIKYSDNLGLFVLWVTVWIDVLHRIYDALEVKGLQFFPNNWQASHSIQYPYYKETYNSNKSPTRCNNFSSLLLDVYLQLNAFRASSRPSSGAQQLQ